MKFHAEPMPRGIKFIVGVFAILAAALFYTLVLEGFDQRICALGGGCLLSAITVASGLRWPVVVIFSSLAGWLFCTGFVNDAYGDWRPAMYVYTSVSAIFALALVGLHVKSSNAWFVAKKTNERMPRLLFLFVAYLAALAVQNIILLQNWHSTQMILLNLVAPFIAFVFGPFLLVIELCHGWTDESLVWALGIVPPYLAYCVFILEASSRTSLWERFGKCSRKIRLGICLVMMIAAAAAIWYEVPEVERVEIRVGKGMRGSEGVRLAVITDLHSCRYGSGQKDIFRKLEEIDKEKPIAALLLAGDIIDDRLDDSVALVLFTGSRWPVFYATGNHEFWTERINAYKRTIRSLGAFVLEGDGRTITCEGADVDICGVDDPVYILEDSWRDQLESASRVHDPSRLGILVSHRPEEPQAYEGLGFDVVVSGHMHGGQWRMPFLERGLMAPGSSDETFFPLHTAGVETLGDGTKLAISRGLAREAAPIPRFFNHPAMMVLDIIPR